MNSEKTGFKATQKREDLVESPGRTLTFQRDVSVCVGTPV